MALQVLTSSYNFSLGKYNLTNYSQKKYWTAIERFKEAIKVNANNYLAMYYVSVIYAILDKKDAEHRMLEFLLKVRLN